MARRAANNSSRQEAQRNVHFTDQRHTPPVNAGLSKPKNDAAVRPTFGACVAAASSCGRALAAAAPVHTSGKQLTSS